MCWGNKILYAIVWRTKNINPIKLLTLTKEERNSDVNIWLKSLLNKCTRKTGDNFLYLWNCQRETPVFLSLIQLILCIRTALKHLWLCSEMVKSLKNHTNNAVEKLKQFKNLNQLGFIWMPAKEVPCKMGEIKNKESEGSYWLTKW